MNTSPGQASGTEGHVTSRDGTRIRYQQLGAGPGIVLVHGGLSAHFYLRLAKELAETYTVSLMERRGYGLSGPQGQDYSLTKECEDVLALLEHTPSAFLFGHSFGALIGLEVALRAPLQKLALFEPPVSIHHSVPLAWLPAYEHALKKRQYAHAMATMLKGLEILGPLSHLPTSVLRILSRLTIRGAEWQEAIQTLSPVPATVRALEALDAPVERYQAITAATLLLTGTLSPTYLREAARTVAAVIPQASLLELPKLNHNAPLMAPHTLAAELKQFFGQ